MKTAALYTRSHVRLLFKNMSLVYRREREREAEGGRELPVVIDSSKLGRQVGCVDCISSRILRTLYGVR